MNIEFMKYIINMKNEIEFNIINQNLMKIKQILVINKIFVNIMIYNDYSLIII